METDINDLNILTQENGVWSKIDRWIDRRDK